MICAYSILKTGIRFCGIRAKSSIADALDGSAARRELFLEPLESAVEMIDAIDHGLAFGGKPRDHQRHRRAQVGRHDRRAAPFRDAFDGRGFTVEMNPRAEPRQ